ncbi:ester cyclase [Candidatus Leptofilum sp.]|uniref:nuclear transport factor 2 family protein n=1 Tax=Candidatus Leptofilum sp. TaxID=3241576 RepID=UPI003B58E14B
MGMQNFSPEFKTPEQYIIDITYRIWEMRGVNLINDWYAADTPVYRPHGVTNTIEAVILHTLEAMSEFPDEEALADDVIIGDKPSGFYSSHRVRSQATHLADGYFGPATNRFVSNLTIADCLCRDNRVVEEWLVSDGASMARQLGHDPVAFGKNLGQENPDAYTIGNEAMRQRWSDPEGLTIVGDNVVANGIIDTYAAIWNDNNLTIMDEKYDRAVRFEGPNGHLCYGRTRTGNWLYTVLASIPDGRFQPHHIIVRQQLERPVRIALRWSYCGTHSGIGRYGDPTGVPVALLGISQFELRDGQIVNEWLVMDETAVYAQIAAHQMAG